MGGQVEYSSVKPYVKYGITPNIITSNETANAVTVMAFTKITTKKVAIKKQIMLGQNSNHLVMIGRYLGYKEITTGIETYKPEKTAAAWVDIYGTGKIAPGLFVGYSANSRASEGATAAYGRAIGVGGRGIKGLCSMIRFYK